ncbi:transcription factor AS1 [Canna indica]|uniref:Transcription factor AS1 n=1 Tax=Canna indica TaxID=4628 RepID=A0AAQ3KFV5_9LILI|nr:transcription factor AS1 [Canna indica]
MRTESNKFVASTTELGKSNLILENFAEKLVKEQHVVPLLMATPFLPPWLSNKANTHEPPSSSVTLALSPSVVPPASKPWELKEGHPAWMEHKKEAAWRRSKDGMDWGLPDWESRVAGRCRDGVAEWEWDCGEGVDAEWRIGDLGL